MWILGFNGLLVKEIGDKVCSLIMVGSFIRDYYYKVRIFKGVFSGCCFFFENLEGIYDCLGFGYGWNKGSKNIFI